MTTAERLLSGPRGRRLCAELLRRAPGGEVVHRALFDAACRADDRRGATGARLVTSATAVRADAVVLPAPLPLAEAVTAVDPAAAVTADALLPALSDTVASAMGWQPPHGEEIALADEAVVAALLPVAEAVLAHPGTAWWSAPIEHRAQCRTVFEGRIGVPAPGPPAGRLAEQRTAALAYEAAAAEHRRRHGTTVGGTWWVAPSTAGLLTTTRLLAGAGSPALWLTEDDFGWDEAEVVPCAVDPGARVLEVRCPEDWAALVAAHPLDVTASRAPDWFGALDPRPGRWLVPDWVSVARELDGVHVSVLAWLTTSGVAVPVPGDAAATTTLAGWDPDATWWLTDVARDEGGRPAAAPGRWSRDDEGRWHPAGR